MEYTESRGILEKMVTNETLAKMTRGSHFNPKPPSNGFRMPSSHLNGKTMPGLSSLAHHHTAGSKSNHEQPRRSVIKLPGPPVNTSGAGAAFKTKSGIPDDTKSLRGRSRKRLREGDPLLDAGSNHDERKDGCEQSTSASETVEPTRRKRRGQSSKRAEKRGGHAPVVEAPVSKLRSSSSTAVPGILDIYGLKSRPVDVSRFMVDVPLDRLLSESLERSRPSAGGAENESGDECRLVIEEISNVMQLLPKHTFVQRPFVENALNEDVKVRLMLDLERPLQPEESQQGEDRQEMAGSLDKARSKSLELFPTFRLEDLPLYTAEDFMDRLKLPVNDSLETLISYSKPTDPGGSASEKNSRFEGIPPSPFSFSPSGVRIEVPRNGKTQWTKDGHLAKARSDPTPMKTDASEQSDGKNHDSRSSVRPKEEQGDDKTDVQRDLKDKSRACMETSKKGFSVHPDLPSLQLKRDEGETSQSRRSLSFPAMPCSPGVQAATILCNMANSDEKEFPPKGKQLKEEGQTQKTVRLGRVGEESRRESGIQQQQQLQQQAGGIKKSPVSEKKRSLSQVNHSLASVSKRLSSTPDSISARSSSSGGHGFNKSDDHRHQHQQQQQQQQQQHHHHHPRESGAKQNSSAAKGNKESHHRDGKPLNGVLSLNVSKNSSSAKSAVASRRESSSLSRSQHSLAKTKSKLR